jgi:GAF domain-containing protein
VTLTYSSGWSPSNCITASRPPSGRRGLALRSSIAAPDSAVGNCAQVLWGRIGPRPSGTWGSNGQQVLIADAAKQLFHADGAGLMLIDADGQLRWASASDQRAQTLEGGQERLAQGPCAVAFSQRLPAAIRNLHTGPDWQEFTQVLLSEGISAALSVPVELDGGVIGTLDIYAREPRDWDPSEVAALQAYAGLVASVLSAAPLSRSRVASLISCKPPWSTVG